MMHVMQMNNRTQRGFTLLELLVVLLIIGLLAGYVGPKYFAQIGKSNGTVAQAQIEAFDKTVEQYAIDTGHYPSTQQGLMALFVRPANEPKWRGPYLKKAPPLDPWGRAYLYASPGGGTPPRDFDIISYGKDGVAGGVDEDADITNY
ncbi:general secretion pathway protein G [Oxalobacteraceae bacterium GrIS 2.11]